MLFALLIVELSRLVVPCRSLQMLPGESQSAAEQWAASLLASSSKPGGASAASAASAGAGRIESKRVTQAVQEARPLSAMTLSEVSQLATAALAAAGTRPSSASVDAKVGSLLHSSAVGSDFVPVLCWGVYVQAGTDSKVQAQRLLAAAKQLGSPFLPSGTLRARWLVLLA